TRSTRDWSSDVCSSDLGRIGFDEIDEIPGNLARGDLLQQRIQGDCRHYSLQEPANCSLRADIHRADFQYRPVLHKFLVQIDIIEIGRASCRERVNMHEG